MHVIHLGMVFAVLLEDKAIGRIKRSLAAVKDVTIDVMLKTSEEDLLQSLFCPYDNIMAV